MAPRAPRDADTLRSAAKFLEYHASDMPDLGEVAAMLEDIADGKWTLVNEGGLRKAGRSLSLPVA